MTGCAAPSQSALYRHDHDDEPDIVDLIRMSLALANFDVITAASGAEALKILETKSADLVLLDVMMPQMTGFEVCEKIRANPKFKSLPVIILTAKGQKEDAEKGLSVGADDYIIKPFDPTELAEQVRSMLDKA